MYWAFCYASEQGCAVWEMGLPHVDSLEALRFLMADACAFAWVENA